MHTSTHKRTFLTNRELMKLHMEPKINLFANKRHINSNPKILQSVTSEFIILYIMTIECKIEFCEVKIKTIETIKKIVML